MSMLPRRSNSRHETPALIAGIAAFTIWGLIPVYWKLLKSVPAMEIIAHRVVWTALFLGLLLTWQRRWPEVHANARSARATLYCITSGAMIAINWLVFIWAVNVDRIIETSLGYFMTPLVNVLFGAIFLREKLTRLQFASVSLGTIAVLNLTFAYGIFPWVALALCVSFGLYGLFRKQSGTAAIPGLFIETVVLVPIAIVYLFILKAHGALTFGTARLSLSILLVSTGIVTAVPLFWFGYATRHLRLVTIGFLQYLAPTGALFLGIFLYHEPFTASHLVTFSLIWIGLAIFTGEALLRWRTTRIQQALAESVCEPV